MSSFWSGLAGEDKAAPTDTDFHVGTRTDAVFILVK